MRAPSAFTLIELLIVVAIIAILAAIAVPNFLEAQTRAKVSRARADIRSVVTAIEAYRIDWNTYPADVALMPTMEGTDSVTAEGFIPPRVSTPVAYLTNAHLPDPFISRGAATRVDDPIQLTLFYQSVVHSIDAAWGGTIAEYDTQTPPALPSPGEIKREFRWTRRWSDGSNWFDHYGGYKLGSVGPDRNYSAGGGSGQLYDPTNGTISDGDIYRTQLRIEGGYPGQ